MNTRTRIVMSHLAEALHFIQQSDAARSKGKLLTALCFNLRAERQIALAEQVQRGEVVAS